MGNYNLIISGNGPVNTNDETDARKLTEKFVADLKAAGTRSRRLTSAATTSAV
jgi:hypothetical protein